MNGRALHALQSLSYARSIAMREDVAEHRGIPAEPSAVSVRKQLDRILQSATFCSAPGLSRFLRHLVEQAIDGTTAPLKEYSVGVEVFDRGSSFDPRIDPIVRVQARKLRAKLSEYYAAEGYDDPILIEVPKGQYVAALRQTAHVDAGESLSFPVRDESQIQGGYVLARTSLPAVRTPLIGRDREVEVVTRMLLSDDVRLVTLPGAGGSGKTRLAIQVASGLISSLCSWRLVHSAGGNLRSRHSSSYHRAALPFRDAAAGDYQICLKGPMLLVIDNAEHLLESAPLFGQLLDATDALEDPGDKPLDSPRLRRASVQRSSAAHARFKPVTSCRESVRKLRGGAFRAASYCRGFRVRAKRIEPSCRGRNLRSP